MGLDMYLTKKVYVGAEYEHRNVTGTVEIFIDGEKVEGIDFKKISNIELTAGYWRKANAIHQWFVDNVQGGEDNCGTYYVSQERMQDLYDIVIEVLADHDMASELLPTQPGFFFGSYEYDDWYFDNLEATRLILLDALNDQNGEYYYSSSW